MTTTKNSRSKYYALENELRRLKRQAFRKSVAAPCRPCPTGAELRAAWEMRRQNREGFIRYLSALLELRPHLDRTIALVPGAAGIRGRGPGLRGWLAANAPDLAPRYKTLARHMHLAVKVARVLCLQPAIPLAAVLTPVTIRRDHDREGLDWLRKNFYAAFANLPPTAVAYAHRVAELYPNNLAYDNRHAMAQYRQLKRAALKRHRSQNSQP